jgi:hypothetical protein
MLQIELNEQINIKCEAVMGFTTCQTIEIFGRYADSFVWNYTVSNRCFYIYNIP